MGNKGQQPKHKKNTSEHQQLPASLEDEGDLRIAAAEQRLLAIRLRLQSVADELSEIKDLLQDEQDNEKPSQVV